MDKKYFPDTDVEDSPLGLQYGQEPEEVGGFGSKGVGEIGLVPTAGAVTGALHQFDGKWCFELPVSRK